LKTTPYSVISYEVIADVVKAWRFCYITSQYWDIWNFTRGHRLWKAVEFLSSNL